MELSTKAAVTFSVGPGKDYENFNADAVEHMLTAAAKNGVKKNGDIYIKLFSGVYVISSPIKFFGSRYNIYIKSSGNAAIIGENTSLFELQGNKLMLEGVRLLQARGDCGGAIQMSQKAELILKDCEFLDNYAKTGGAIWAENSRILIESCQFKGNSAENAGVIYMSGGSIEVKNTQFTNNKAKKSHAVMKLHNNCDAKLMTSQICNNTAEQYYGGISVMFGSGLYMDECIVSGNTSGGDVAGIFAAQKCSVTVIDCKIQNNIADNSTGILIADKSKLVMHDSSVSANTARKSCAGLMVAANSAISINNCEVCENLAQNAGAISSHPDCSITLCACKILGNRAENNIGAIGANGKLIVKDCVIQNNTAVSQAGGILVGDQARVNINGCTILDNCAGLGLNILLVPEGSLKINKYPVLFNVNTPVTPQTIF